MAKYKPLKFIEVLDVTTSINEKTGESETVRQKTENYYNEILDFVKLSDTSGELTLKVKVMRGAKGFVNVITDVSKKFQKQKNQVELVQDENGKVFLDNPDQQVLPILPVGTSK